MSSYKVEKILSEDKTFIGCYAHDRLPEMKDKIDCVVILNRDCYYTEGDHRVAVKMTKYNCFYFYSFGVVIVDENIKLFVSRYDKVLYSNICIQDIRSVKCGEFCLAHFTFLKID